MRQLVFTLIINLVATLVAAYAEEPFHDVGGGWHEAWIGVSDLDRMENFFTEVAGWERVNKGAIDRDTLAFIAPDARSGRFIVMRSPDYPQGWTRIFDIEGAERPIIRSNAQAWDTGGIFSLMTRSADAERNLRDAERIGWTAYNDPYDFGFGDLRLRNIVLRGPDGVNVAIYEWIAPKRADARPAGALSKAFNAMQMVADLDASLKFYVDGLGFRIVQKGEFIDAVDQPTNFALPVNLATKVKRRYAILIPEGGNDEAGRVELMEFEGLAGRDLSSHARLDARGVASLLFPVEDLDAAATQAAACGARFVREVAAIDLAPYGRAHAFTIASPDGALLTFFQPAED
jgi:catechol 2,3-dioxygenase-like lactoylglutathione lyase family enzyme